MASYIPLIVDDINNRIKELPSGDTLNTEGSILVADEFKSTGKVYSEIVSLTGSGGTVTIDLETGGFFNINLTASSTIAFANSGDGNAAAAGNAHAFMIQVVNTGFYSVLWPNNVRFDGGVTPNLGSNSTSVFSLYTTDGGTLFRAALVSNTST